MKRPFLAFPIRRAAGRPGKAQRCALELSVHQAEPGQVRVRNGWGWREGDQEVIPLDRLDAGFVTDRVLRLLQAL